MNVLLRSLFVALVLTSVAQAQDVGIQFGKMPVGTTLVTEVYSSKPFKLSEKYIGERDGFFVTEVTRLTKDGETKFSSTSFYDSKGRLVRRDRAKGFEEYVPYSCEYVVGECKHDYQYPNPFKDYKQTKGSEKRTNRLEGDTLIVSWKLIDGSVAEVPFKLGPYNLRVSNDYKNRLGQQSGYKFVELIEPDKKSSLETAEKPEIAQAGTEQADYCTALYNQLRAETTGDVSKCTPVLREAKTKQCRLPSSSSSERQPSHIVMILDASGSMAGKIGRKQKMSVAKREARKFLRDLAKDVPVGLVVYGHRGTNKESGKAESCAGVEWALPVGSKRSKVNAAVKQLEPTGWTPMAGALDFAKTEIETLPAKEGDKTSIPVVYLISDGKETCGGDPAASARALHESGTRALVNVIGFDVDTETRSQLEAISEAGGGKYFAAKDSAALAKHLRSASEAVNSKARFEYCLNLNQGYAETIYNSASNSVPACFRRESEKKTLDVIRDQVDAFTKEEDIACARAIKRLARKEHSLNVDKMSKLFRSLIDGQKAAGQAARKRATDEALPPK